MATEQDQCSEETLLTPEPVATYRRHDKGWGSQGITTVRTFTVYEFAPRRHIISVTTPYDDDIGAAYDYGDERQAILPTPWTQIVIHTVARTNENHPHLNLTRPSLAAVTCSPQPCLTTGEIKLYQPLMPNNMSGQICGIHLTSDSIAAAYEKVWQSSFTPPLYCDVCRLPEEALDYIVDFDPTDTGYEYLVDSFHSYDATLDWEQLEALNPEEMCTWGWREIDVANHIGIDDKDRVS